MTRPVLGTCLALVAFGATGCAILGGGDHEFGKSSLSDAAAQARPDTAKVRRDEAKARSEPLDVGWKVPDDEESPPSASPEEGEPTEPGSWSSLESLRMVFGLVGGGGALGGASYDGYGMGGIDLGAVSGGRWRTDLIGSVGGVSFAGPSVAGQSFTNEFELALDVTVRRYLTPSHTAFGLYPIAGTRFGTLFWDFAQPITVIEDGQPRQIESDQVDFFSLYGGAGASFLQVRHFTLGAHLTAGLRLYSWRTRQGLSNDLFPATGFAQLMVEAGYRH
jgi:hypothetical protein